MATSDTAATIVIIQLKASVADLWALVMMVEHFIICPYFFFFGGLVLGVLRFLVPLISLTGGLVLGFLPGMFNVLFF
jgi:hypothetical protein